MSYEATVNSVNILNWELQFFYERNEPILVDVNSRPTLEVFSFEPLVYEKYGRYLHRAPQLKGSLALRGMITEPHPVIGVRLFGLVGLEDRGYGLEFEPNRESDVAEVNRIAQYLGHNAPNFRLAV
jgi:hypothetical protein